MTFTPNEHYRYSLKTGMSGWDVFAVQIAVNAAHISANLVEDGVFGPLTDLAARKLQTSLKVTSDGIIGPQTQSALCARECATKERTRTPAGLLKGVCFGESGGIIPTTSPFYADGSRDFGPFQNHMTQHVGDAVSEQQLKESFSPPIEALNLANGLQSAYSVFKGKAGAPTDQAAWELAVLNYNWPAMANKLVKVPESQWGDVTYIETGTEVRRKMTDPAPWVEQYKVPGVYSGLDWARFYIQSKVVYVRNWTVA